MNILPYYNYLLSQREQSPHRFAILFPLPKIPEAFYYDDTQRIHPSPCRPESAASAGQLPFCCSDPAAGRTKVGRRAQHARGDASTRAHEGPPLAAGRARAKST